MIKSFLSRQTVALLAALAFTSSLHALEIPVDGDTQIIQSSATFNYGHGVNLGVTGTSGSIRWSYFKFDVASYLPTTTSADISKVWLHVFVNAVTGAGLVDVIKVTSAWNEGTANGAAQSGTVTYNNKPTDNGTVLATFPSPPFVTTDDLQYFSIDVTAALKSWLDTWNANQNIPNDTPNFSVVFKPHDSTVVILMDAKEATATSHPAVLDVTFKTSTKWLNGTTNPVAATGSDGDFYLNTQTSTYFGPKANGAWPAGTLLVGPTGPTGATGSQGAAGTNGTNGATGAQGPVGPQGPATLRILASGDVSMGSFTNGTLP
jgi:hypothetical protein